MSGEKDKSTAANPPQPAVAGSLAPAPAQHTPAPPTTPAVTVDTGENDGESISPDDPLTRKERIDVALEAWKQTVDVQQHFNDLSVRIRNLAITVLGAVFSVAGLILKDNRESFLPAWIVLAGAVLCLGFYLMDAGWYHRLLMGSVYSATPLEHILTTDAGVPVKLGQEISKASPIVLPFKRLPWKRLGMANEKGEMHSKHKLNLFWRGLLVVTLIVAYFLRDSAVDARENAANAKASAAAQRQDSISAASQRDSIALLLERAESSRVRQLQSGKVVGDTAKAPAVSGRGKGS